MNTTPYFEREALLSNFHAALNTALEELSLSIPEVLWLRRLADDSTAPDSMRVEAQVNAQPLASSCLLIHQRDPALQAVYMYSPLHGVQGFNNLQQLESALQAELAHLGVPTDPLQFIELTDPVFEQWSERLLQQQIDLLESLASRLGKLPNLRSAVDTGVKTAFSTLLEGVDSITGHRLQIVAEDTVVRTEALADAALNVFSGEPLGLGLRRRFLRGDGREWNTAYDFACEQALLASAKALPETLAQALRDYWDARDELTTDRREDLALAIANNYARALLRAANSKLIDTEQLEWMREALIPGTQTVGIHTLDLKITHEEEHKYVPLADSLVLLAPTDSRSGVFLFTPSTGLRAFSDQARLKQHCRALLTKADRPESISPSDWEALQHAPPGGIRLTKIDTAPFLSLADSLIALISRRLEHALRFPGAQSSTAAATVEDALDIRSLIDARLPKLANTARWPRRSQDISAPGLPPLPDQSLTLQTKLAHGKAIVQLLHRLERVQPNMRAVVRDSLAPCISALSDGTLEPDEIQIRYGSHKVSLVEYFLRRFCSTQPDDPALRIEILNQHDKPLRWISTDALRRQLEALTLTFSAFYLEQLKNFDNGQLRVGKGVSSVPATMRTLYEAMLRLELSNARAQSSIDGALLDLLQQALDSPQQTLADAQYRISALGLKLPGKSGVLTLTGAFVLRRAFPEGGPLLLWSPLEPLSQFDDEQTLRKEMDGALKEPQKLYRWLDLVHAEDLRKWHSPSVLPGVTTPDLVLATATTDVFTFLEDTERNYRANTRRYYLSYSIRSEFESLLMEHFIDAIAVQYPTQKPINSLLIRLESQYFQSLLPAWLSQATPQQMAVYATLVQASMKVANDKFNYMFDIPKIQDFANVRLTEGLLRSYPQAPSDPSLITMTFTHFSPNFVPPGATPSPISADTFTTSKSLTEYALTHSDIIGTASTMTASAALPGEAPLVLDGIKLRKLVDELDIATAYRTLLAAKLSPTSPDHAERRMRYTHTASAYLMEEAYQHFLEKKISAAGMSYVSHVFNQPDALARDTVNGKTISISQLQLKAAPDLAPDSVRGMYVIGPNNADQGPLVMYCAYLPDKLFREFANQAALRTAILADMPLQKEMLQRLPESVHARYNHNGFLQPHIFWSSDDLLDIPAPPEAVQLVRQPIEGNAWHYLYEENNAQLNELAKARTVTTSQARWQRFRYVVSLGIEQCTFFLPGKLAILVNSLQSAQWLKGSHDAALKKNWGEALAEFITALSSLASLRFPQNAASRKTSALPVVDVPNLEISPGRDTALHQPSLQERLGSLQAHDIQLKDLTNNTALGLFLNATSDRYFAAVRGNVYEVRKSGNTWRIIKGSVRGPKLQRIEGQWQVDLEEGLRGGGASVSGLEAELIDEEIESRFTTLAAGMKTIRAEHPLKDAMLARAYGRAQRYLEICLENLNSQLPDAQLPPRTTAILRAILGHEPTPQTVNLLRDYTRRILSELLSDSLSLADSKRIVVGVNMPNVKDTYAFVYNNDPQKRIFLTERFFNLAFEVEAYVRAPREELLAHQQAVTLIHELSHQTLKAVDIAYVEASLPFTDQFSLETQGGRSIYSQVVDYRRRGLSHSTEDDKLFKIKKYKSDWRDLEDGDGEALATIFRLTKKDNLIAARAEFHDKAQVRTDIILANADSLALFISKLGRRRFTPAG